MKPSIMNSRHAQLALVRRRRQQAALGVIATCTVCQRQYPASTTNGWGIAHSAGVCSFTCYERKSR